MTVSATALFALFVAFEIKHFLADFVLQTKFMAQKSATSWKFLYPLLSHSLVHAVGTLIIAVVYAPDFWWLCLLDLVVHSMIDRVKSGRRYFGRFADTGKQSYWIIFGADQLAHHLTHFGFIYLLVR